MILNSLTSDISSNAVQSAANFGGNAGVANQSRSVSLSGAGTGSGGQGMFSETLNGSINNPDNNSAANQPVNNNLNNNARADASPANNNSSAAAPKDKSKKGGVKTGGNGSGGQMPCFIGNTGIILQSVSAKKENNNAGNSGIDKNSEDKNANAAASSDGIIETGKNNKTASSDISNNAAAGLSVSENIANGTNLNQLQNNNNNNNGKDIKDIVKNGGRFNDSANRKSGDTPAGSASLNLESVNIAGYKNTPAVSGGTTNAQEQANNSAGSAGIKDGGKKNTGNDSQTLNASDTKISNASQKTNTAATAAENALKNIENQINQNSISSINSKNTGTLIKDAVANSLDLTALNGEIKSVLSGTDGKDSVSGGIAGNAASGTAGGNKIIDFINAGSSQISGVNNSSASNGNSAGFNLSGGNIFGANDSAGETSGSFAVNSVMFMLKRNVQSATITLTPPSLGSVKIDISLNSLNSPASASNGSITINMLTQNEAAKNILQSSSDSLQNALKNQGFSSINLNISTGSGYNNQTGGNGNETPKNPFINNRYNGSSFANGSSGSGGGSKGLNIAAYRNPDALIDYFV